MVLTLSKSHTSSCTSREIRLKARPTGLLRPENFELVEVPLPTVRGDQLLLRNRFIRVASSMRMMISEGAEAIEGVPFPALKPGDALGEAAVAEVLAAPAASGFAEGDLVSHHDGFREFAAVPAGACVRVDPNLPEPLMHLGHGWTAYAALKRCARVRAGDVVFVSSAAGAIGSMAAMIARRLGARRVIGSTSSRDKAQRLQTELRYDAAVIRGEGSIREQLRGAAPEGIDVALDNVGGEQLAAAIEVARHGARLVVLGALSGQLAVEGTGRTAPVTLDSFPILLKRLEIRGYSADDDSDAQAEFNSIFADAVRAGEMHFPHVRIRGIEQAPKALCDVAAGRYVGTVLIEV
ncbi:MAG: NADP-dependent oxidoreductase [Polyangiaceae bacterium]